MNLPFIAAQSNSAPCQSETVQQRQRLGTSSEWAGNSQPSTFQELMARSKVINMSFRDFTITFNYV